MSNTTNNELIFNEGKEPTYQATKLDVTWGVAMTQESFAPITYNEEEFKKLMESNPETT